MGRGRCGSVFEPRNNAARGHDVSVITNPYFAPLIERVGLRLVPLGTVEQYEAVTAKPDLWSQIRGLQVIAEAVAQATPELYRAVEAECRARPALVVAAGLAFGARIAHETPGLPLVTVHLQPSCFHSLHESPVMTSWLWSINRLPRSLKRGSSGCSIWPRTGCWHPVRMGYAANSVFPAWVISPADGGTRRRRGRGCPATGRAGERGRRGIRGARRSPGGEDSRGLSDCRSRRSRRS